MAASHGDEQLLEAVERSISERQSKRHLLIELEGGAVHTCSVAQDDKVLRTPKDPIRPLALESLASLPGVCALVEASGTNWEVPLGDWKELSSALVRAQQNHYGGRLTFRIPRRALLGKLVELARSLADLHRQERVHGDVAPGNVLLTEAGAVSYDSLDIAIGTPATAATFAWAAPEQIVGLPVDPGTDVYSLTRMAAAMIDGVPFGEETHYVVPIGGTRSRRVKLLKTEGVYLDILDSGHGRPWQVAWQEFLGRGIAYDRDKRIDHAESFADELAGLLESHPPTGSMELGGDFGDIVHMQRGESWTFARVVGD
jgi:hypothetical protein